VALKVIGVDIGTSLGWSVVEDGALLASGQVELKRNAWEGFGVRPMRARALVLELLGAHPGAVVAVELVRRHAATQAAQVYGAILGGVTCAVEEAGDARYLFVDVSEAKLAATGYGAEKKTGMVAAACQAFKLDKVGEDQADAIWVAVAAWRRESGSLLGALTGATPSTPASQGGKVARRARKAGPSSGEQAGVEG
jgi:Holliday junction resolvasome RuvABC endonuclease subunit